MCTPGDGHWFDGRDRRIAVFVAMERFFAKRLGGRVQRDVPEAVRKRLDAITVNVKDVVVSKPVLAIARRAHHRLDRQGAAPFGAVVHVC